MKNRDARPFMRRKYVFQAQNGGDYNRSTAPQLPHAYKEYRHVSIGIVA
jgi:hypothetical protein